MKAKAKKQKTITVHAFTQPEITKVFTEWDRRFRENPEQFEAEAVRLIRGNPKTYGESAAPYFLHIAKEIL